jgi:hypothetical protein
MHNREREDLAGPYGKQFAEGLFYCESFLDKGTGIIGEGVFKSIDLAGKGCKLRMPAVEDIRGNCR